MNFKKIVREPLLHFALIGVGLFAWYGAVAPESSEGQKIIISQPIQLELARQFQATWSRPPTKVEMVGLIDNYIRDEILYREGVAIGLEKNDTVIKRRLRQKLEVLIEEQGNSNPATDADLNAYLTKHADEFRKPPVLTFEQIYFNPADYGNNLEQAIKTAQIKLQESGSPENLGSSSMLPSNIKQQPADLVAREFGEKFSQSLVAMPVGSWQGPVESGFGLHLVRVQERKEGYLPALNEVQQVVAREWESARRKNALEENYQRIKKEYDVVIESDNAETDSKQ